MGTSTALSQVPGSRIVELARQHIGEKYVLGVLVPKDNPTWRGPWDCAEFASWLVFQSTGVLYGCSNDSTEPAIADAYTGFWRRDAESLGQAVPVEGASRTAGAFIVRLPQTGAIGHIVVSDGQGGTVEAHCSKTGVIASTLSGRRWDTGILVPGIQHSPGSPVTVVPPKRPIYRWTTPVMTGHDVQEIQENLQAAGFDSGPVDGVFGPHTHAAVIAFQLTARLVADAEVGPITARALRLRASRKTRTT